MKHLTGLSLFLSIATVVFLFPLSSFYFNLLDLNPAVLPVLQGLSEADILYDIFVNSRGFEEQEIEHFADVRALIVKGQMLLLITSLALCAMAVYKPHHIKESLKHPLFYTGGLISLIGLIWLVLGWKKLTAILHTLAFPAGNWRFSSGSLTIELYGRSLMQAGVLTIVGLLLLTSIGLFFLQKKLSKQPA